MLFIPSCWDDFSSDIIFLPHDTFSLVSLILQVNYLSFLLSEKEVCFHFVKEVFTGYWILVDSFIFLSSLKRCDSIVHRFPLFLIISLIILTIFLWNIMYLFSKAFMFLFLFSFCLSSLTLKSLVMDFFMFIFFYFAELLQICELLFWL